MECGLKRGSSGNWNPIIANLSEEHLPSSNEKANLSSGFSLAFTDWYWSHHRANHPFYLLIFTSKLGERMLVLIRPCERKLLPNPD